VRQRLRMTGSAKQQMEMRCSSCKQAIGGISREPATSADANLFGAGKYVVCPTCNQVVPKDLITPAYKSIWTEKRLAQVQHSVPTDAEQSNQETRATGIAKPLDQSQQCAGQKAASPKDVAEWMYEQVNQKAVLWQAYAVVEIADRFGKSFIDNDKSGEPVVSQMVLAEFRRLSGDAVIWDEDLAQWRLR
jgi:uncharacterized protein DUF6953